MIIILSHLYAKNCHIIFFFSLLASRRAWCYAALAPAKDAELVLHGRSLACPALAALLFAALRALADGLGVTAFNVAALHMRPDGAPSGAGLPVVVRRARSGKHSMLGPQADDYAIPQPSHGYCVQ